MDHLRTVGTNLDHALPLPKSLEPELLLIGDDRGLVERLRRGFAGTIDVGKAASVLAAGEARRNYAVVVVAQTDDAANVLALLRVLERDCPCTRCVWAAAGGETMAQALNEQLLWRAAVHPGDDDELARHVCEALGLWCDERQPRGAVQGFLGC